MAEIKKANEELEQTIKYQLGAKYSNPYYDERSTEAGNVLVHAQPKNAVSTSGQSKKSNVTCEVVNCKVRTTKKCLTKACSRYLCSTHFIPGGHKAHANFEFKASKSKSSEEATASSSVPVVAATDNLNNSSVPTIATESISSVPDEAAATDTSDSAASCEVNVVTPTVCQVLECTGVAKHRCSELECRFIAVCDMHYARQHNSHFSMFHVDDESRKTSNKRLKV